MTAAAVPAEPGPVAFAGARAAPAPTAPTAPTRRSVGLAYLAMAGVVAIWGVGPPISKLVIAPPSTVAPTRMWMAVFLTYLVMRAGGRHASWRAVRGSIWGGALFGTNMLLFFTTLQHASIATLTLLGVLQPIVVGLVSVRMFDEKLTRWGLTWTAVAIAGVAAAVLTAGKGVRATPLGVLLAVGTTLCLAGYMVASRRARNTLRPNEYLFGVMLWAAALLTIPLLAQGPRWNEIAPHEWGWLLLIMVGPGWLGHLLMSWAITEIPMSISSLVMLPTTVVSIALAWPINHQHVTPLQGLAGAATLVAVAMVVRDPTRNRIPSRPS